MGAVDEIQLEYEAKKEEPRLTSTENVSGKWLDKLEAKCIVVTPVMSLQW